MVKEHVGKSAHLQSHAGAGCWVCHGAGVPKVLCPTAGDGPWTDKGDRPWMLFNLGAHQKPLCLFRVRTWVCMQVCAP